MSETAEAPWRLVSARPLAFGGWQFELADLTMARLLEWFPGDRHLFHAGRPFLGAPVLADTGKAARIAVAALLVTLNEMEHAA